VVPRSITFVFKVLCTLVQNFGVNQFQTGAQQITEGSGALCAATSRRPCAARRAPRPCDGHLGVRARTPPEPRAFPRLTPRPEVPRFYPAPCVAPRRPLRTCVRRAPGGPPVRSALRRMRASRGSALPRRNPRRHHVVTVGRVLYLRPPFLLPLTPSPPLQTAPPRHHGRRRRTRLPAPL
jgi:hypothetical protein